MRWIWIDRIEAFESGRRATAVKNVTAAEDHLHDQVPGFPLMPATLMIEGMAQTAGILVGEARQFGEKVILAKIKQATFDAVAVPGDQIRYAAEIETISAAAASTRGTIFINGEPSGRVDIVFSHVDQNMSGLDLPEENFVFTPEFMALLNGYRRDGGGRVLL